MMMPTITLEVVVQLLSHVQLFVTPWNAAHVANIYLTLLFIYLFFGHHVAHGIFVLWLGIKPVPPALEMKRLNHWTTREVPLHIFHMHSLVDGL